MKKIIRYIRKMVDEYRYNRGMWVERHTNTGSYRVQKIL